jgi:hypothetical protein
VTALRHVLLSWKQYPDGAPGKIIYMLEHKYSQANLSASALKSRDAHLLAILDGLAKELGFCLGLANIEHSQRGCADDEYGPRRGWGRYGDDSDEEDDGDDVGMAEVDEEDTSVKNLVNIEGKPIKREVDFDDEVETIPRFSGYFEGEDYDHQDYEGYQGNVRALHHRSASCSHCFHRAQAHSNDVRLNTSARSCSESIPQSTAGQRL